MVVRRIQVDVVREAQGLKVLAQCQQLLVLWLFIVQGLPLQELARKTLPCPLMPSPATSL